MLLDVLNQVACLGEHLARHRHITQACSLGRAALGEHVVLELTHTQTVRALAIRARQAVGEDRERVCALRADVVVELDQTLESISVWLPRFLAAAADEGATNSPRAFWIRADG